MLAFTAKLLLTPTENVDHPLLLVEDGTIAEIANQAARTVPPAATLVDLGDSIVAPGYLDLHIHGSAGFDVMDDNPAALPAIEHLLAQHGVTAYYPTTVTAPLDATLSALQRLAHAVEHSKLGGKRSRAGASPLGIHLEGPFISHARKGVHPPDNLLPPTLATFERFWQAARGHIKMMTIAPELDGAAELIAEATRRGVCVSLGHSDANFDTAEGGIAAGARHATHTFNAMRPLDHRGPGILGAVLTDCRVSADMIVDGVHLDPAIVKLVARAKGLEQTVLITDATSATGMPDGRYHLGSFEVEVKGGKCMANGKLAGSILTMDNAVRNLARFTGWTLSQAVAAASRNPARVARLANKGVLTAGADADFVVLNPAGEVLRTFIGGVECSTQ
ncbi:MAG: N-acetylglucosamine-6-phosphate deacetylase [Acidobacteria bacterium]|nr:N-acetylglucosamine-6-phosphate deacetylase [Acidobacteriota bacterium]